MTSMTLTSARRTTWSSGFALGSVAGAALAVAGVWNALIQLHVTVASPPQPLGPDVSPVREMRAHYTWYAGTVGQERADTILAMVGVTGLVLLAVELRRLRSDVIGRAACSAIQIGGLVWLVGALATIGGHRAVALMATHANPIQTVNAIAFTTDVTNDAYSAAALLLLGGATVAVGLAAMHVGSARWRGFSLLTGAVSVVVAVGYLEHVDALTTFALGALAAVLLPVWLAWTGLMVDREAHA
jgi:hypothetical protein